MGLNPCRDSPDVMGLVLIRLLTASLQSKFWTANTVLTLNLVQRIDLKKNGGDLMVFQRWNGGVLGVAVRQREERRIQLKPQVQNSLRSNKLKNLKELSEEELKKMMEIVPAEEVYIEALQVKRPIIDWEVYSEGQIKYWKIVRVGEMLRKFDREDLDKLWSLVKETFSTTNPTEDKERLLWVELKRLYEPDPRDQLWALQKYMHDPLEWKLYNTCGVHHVSTGRGYKIFMLVEKDYPLTKGLTTVMLYNKLQVDQYSEMANELLMKIYSIANSPR
ncbi:hypothetical protein Tco_1018452 [Tanacetum coccineum]|uniref:Uncharacterized protein n=1 Tax=Tanacetum coccineum TaxID=301880 RepID=A0ABQ5FWD0_9ASTR